MLGSCCVAADLLISIAVASSSTVPVLDLSIGTSSNLNGILLEHFVHYSNMIIMASKKQLLAIQFSNSERFQSQSARSLRNSRILMSTVDQ